MNEKEIINYLIEEGYGWIQKEQKVRSRDSRILSEQEKNVLFKYYTSKVLGEVRIDYVDCIENPPFFSDLIKRKIPISFDFSLMAGITFIDRIVLARTKLLNKVDELSVIFHELVHVVQYNKFGARKFVELYIHGWAENGFNYYHIPLERQAYKLQAEFNSDNNNFSVEDELRDIDSTHSS
jgi:hypothetical protein